MKLLSDNRLIAWGTVVGALLTAVSLIVGGVVYAVRLRDDASASQRVDIDHEGRLRTIESGVAELRADFRETNVNVTWIRHFLDRQQPVQPGEPQKTASN